MSLHVLDFYAIDGAQWRFLDLKIEEFDTFGSKL